MRTHLSLAPNIRSLSLTFAGVFGAATSLSLTAIPNDSIVARVTGSGTFLASSIKAMTSFSN